jgi:phosphoribosylamine--glycine ligase
MKILVIGQGGREHALAWKLSQSKKSEIVFVAPGNGGTSTEEKCLNVSIKVNDFPGIKKFIIEEQIELVVIGPEDPLVNGLVDYLQDLNILIFGPCSNGARLEGSKIFSKKFLFENDIPTGKASFFSDPENAYSFLDNCEYPIVLKADGLAAGKGVLVSKNVKEAKEWVDSVMNNALFGVAGENILIEECLYGTELSFMGVMTPSEFIPFETSVDYKPLLNRNKGPNTGGMGCISPSPFMNDVLREKIIKKVVQPTIDGLNKMGVSYYGFMYFGLMVKDDNPQVLEFNCRLGDPETQCLMMQMDSDLVECLEDALNNKKVSISWKQGSSMGVVIASSGYPEKYKTKLPIKIGNLDKLKLFHAGTEIVENELLTSGGRVFSLNYHASNLEDCMSYIYNRIDEIKFDGTIYRTDIGKIYES